MLTTLDYLVIVVYFIGVAVFGIVAGGRQRSTEDYFLGGRNLPWWAVCFSVIATETSTLTVIGVPAVSYLGTLTFLQITLGYVVGRIVVSLYFLPRYYQGQLTTAYAFLGERFGDGMRVTASLTFLLTRLLADGVRLFATAIPIKVIADSVGLETTYFQIILLIGIVTMAYTLIGGIKAVVWMDVVQMGVYVGGGILAALLLWNGVPDGWWAEAAAAGKTQLLDLDWTPVGILTKPYAFFTALVGGAIFSMASHGTDQLIVQRLFTCRTLQDSQRALVVSGFAVMFQFGLFLLVGLLLWAHYGGADLATLGLTRGDEVFPRFIIEGLPPGLSGLMLAGILAAAMSTLSSSLNALAGSTMMDLYERLRGQTLEAARALTVSRLLTLFWGIVFIGFATLFEDRKNPVVELGLAIASFTYGGLLGAFLLGLLNRQARQVDAVLAFLFTIVVMVGVIWGVWYGPETGWIWAFRPSPELIASEGLRGLAWPWYTTIGASLMLTFGSLLGLRHR